MQLFEYYYDLGVHGYCTRPLAINTEEISDFHETDDVDRGYRDAVKISLKNGRTYNVKGTYNKILGMIANEARYREIEKT